MFTSGFGAAMIRRFFRSNGHVKSLVNFFLDDKRGLMKKAFSEGISSNVPRVNWKRGSVDTDDGLRLSFQTAGSAAGDPPVVLLANGIGVTTPGMDVLAEYLQDRFHVICWDYRGTGASRVARFRARGKKIDYSIERHARDAIQIMDHLGVDRVAVLGWSMGVPVGLEMIRAAEERVVALGALFGAAGRPFEHSAPLPVVRAIYRAAGFFQKSTLPVQVVLDAANRLPWACREFCSGLGFVGKHANSRVFSAAVAAVAGADHEAYFATMTALMEHDAFDMLPSIKCPVLVVCGGKDLVTRPEAAYYMAERIPGAKIVMLEDATHFGVMEYGRELWDPIDELLSFLLRADQDTR